MLFGLFLTLGVAVLSVALRSFQTSFAQKLGALGVLIATFLAEKWSDLDDLELPVVLRIEVNPAVSDQPPAAGPKLLAALSKPP